MKEKDLLLKEIKRKSYNRKKKETTEEVTRPDQKWSIDIKYGKALKKALNGEKGYIIAVKDCYSKEILSVQVERKKQLIK